jgi:hypothetical protein
MLLTFSRPLALFAFLTVGIGIELATPAFVSAAVTPTPTLTPIALPTAHLTEVPASQSGTVNQNLKKVIDKVVEENKDAITAKIQTAEAQRRGLVGQVKSIREGTLTLTTSKGTQIIPTDKNVQLIKAGKFITFETIAVDDWVTVIGNLKTGDFQPEKVIVSSQSLQTVKPLVSLGSIEALTKTTLGFKDRNGQETKTWQITKTTQWQDSRGGKATQANFSTSLQALFIGLDSTTTPTATIVRALAPFGKPTP